MRKDIPWSVVAKVKPPLEVLLADRAAHKSEQEEWLLDKSWEEITTLHLLLDLKALGIGIEPLPDKENQIMFETGEEVRVHEVLDSLMRGEAGKK